MVPAERKEGESQDKTRSAFIAWFIVGTVITGMFQMLRSEAAGGPAGLIDLGEKTPAHEIVLTHLPSAPVTPDEGHDGQMFYVIATDLTAEQITSDVVSPYRYRRILYPAVASLGGVLEGRALLWGMILVGALAGGIGSGATAVIGLHFGMRPLIPLAAALNPGVLLSAMFLTADGLAFGLGLLGLAAFLKSKDPVAIGCLAAAALAKETHLLFAVGIAAYLWFRDQRRRSAAYLLLPALPLGLWLVVVAVRLGNPLETAGNLVLPFVGIAEAAAYWPEAAGIELFWTVFAVAGLVLSAVSLWRGDRLIKWMVLPWLILAATSSHLIWDLGNNSMRTLAPLFTLGILGVRSRGRQSVSRREAVPSA